jgi:tRNA (guanine37-N1)-methyltransferase
VRVDVITIFPDYLAPLALSLVGKARESGVIDLRVHDLREWAPGRHRSVDDTPYGGGAGMVMRPDVWGMALDAVVPSGASPASRLVVPTPSGRRFDQALAQEFAAEPWLVFACGRYEGIDARVVEDAATRMPVDEVSLGDYVLSGGEAPVLVILEAVARLLPGVVGNPESLVEESHGADGLLEYPVYTKPPSWRGLHVPEVLLSGHHAHVARWRRDQALRRTAERRPDLLDRLDPSALDAHDLEVLASVGWTPPGPRARQEGDHEAS